MWQIHLQSGKAVYWQNIVKTQNYKQLSTLTSTKLMNVRGRPFQQKYCAVRNDNNLDIKRLQGWKYQTQDTLVVR